MRTDLARSSSGWRRLLVAAIAVLGVAAIVGSGGGGFFDGICDVYPDSCQVGPPVPGVVVTPPAVTAQVGSPVTFVARPVNISGSVSYRWQRSADGGRTYQDIAGATNGQYTIATVNLGDDGTTYRVTVANGQAELANSEARLVVSAAPPIEFADGEFALLDWTASPGIVAGNPSFPHAEERSSSGGNPGAFRRMTVEVAAGTGLSRVIHFAAAAVYDPQVHGAIYVIDYAEQCAMFSSDADTFVEVGPALEQAGRRYLFDGVRHLCGSAQWTSASQASLRASDFFLFDGPACGAGESCPDFSSSAPPIRLGYDRVAFGGYGGISSVAHGIDNWRISVWRR